MSTNNYKNQLDTACEKFRAILEAQLERVEDMKTQRFGALSGAFSSLSHRSTAA